ncbi:MAG: hypothetical protein JW839_01495 [Candidatus Lokiarchaeota archaeon]|nr:hypothetical protein [Candidatus Lokiarchaeota archaeon]
MGLDLYFWIGDLSITVILGIIFLLKGMKNPLVNKKELYLGSGVFYICTASLGLFGQIGFFIQESYLFYNNLGLSLEMTGFCFFIYFWERNLINLRKIPSFLASVESILTWINFGYGAITGKDFVDLYPVFLLGFSCLTVVFLVVLVGKFTRLVVGALKVPGAFLLFSIFGYLAYRFFAFDWSFTIIPGLSPFISPVIGGIVAVVQYIFMTKAIDGISSYYQQARICLVHRGPIDKNEKIYLCPECTAPYCHSCFEQVIKNDGCWNCKNRGVVEKTAEAQIHTPSVLEQGGGSTTPVEAAKKEGDGSKGVKKLKAPSISPKEELDGLK